MHKHSNLMYSNLELCFGREDLCNAIVGSALESGAVLLFGGRQAGKTTVLRKIERDLSEAVCSIDDLQTLNVPVYVDLMQLPYDAKPQDFFSRLSGLALSACRRQIRGFELQSLSKNTDREDGLVDSFIAHIQTIFEAAGEVGINFIFLLDEAKRVLGDRFPRGFQDNLFNLLFGGHAVSSHYSMVFAGAQDLYRFCEDDTSPIGSRAAKYILTNLDGAALAEMVDCAASIADETHRGLENHGAIERADMIFAETGGHAGLSAYLSFKLATLQSNHSVDLKSVVHNFQLQHSELFRIWTARLSAEARLICERLIVANDLTLSDTARILEVHSMSSFDADRVFDELQFTGLAVRSGDTLSLVNRMYADVARNYIVKPEGTETERPVWSLLEELELNLRRLVWQRFDQRWHGRIDHQIHACLGDETWEIITDNKMRYARNYDGSSKNEQLNTLDFTYLGQLGQLMTWKSAWDLFKPMFRDKRDLEDMLHDITPVRNDSAHFRSVPKKELDRCRIRCEDLLAIIEREQANN